MVRFDCEKPVKHVALISDEVASSHCYLERERERERDRNRPGVCT